MLLFVDTLALSRWQSIVVVGALVPNRQEVNGPFQVFKEGWELGLLYYCIIEKLKNPLIKP